SQLYRERNSVNGLSAGGAVLLSLLSLFAVSAANLSTNIFASCSRASDVLLLLLLLLFLCFYLAVSTVANITIIISIVTLCCEWFLFLIHIHLVLCCSLLRRRSMNHLKRLRRVNIRGVIVIMLTIIIIVLFFLCHRVMAAI